MTSLTVGNKVIKKHQRLVTEMVTSQVGADQFFLPTLADLANSEKAIQAQLKFTYDSTHVVNGVNGIIEDDVRIFQAFADTGVFYAYGLKTKRFELYTADAGILAELGVAYNMGHVYAHNAQGIVYAFRLDVSYPDLSGRYEAKAVSLSASRKLAIKDYIFVPYLSVAKLLQVINSYNRSGKVMKIRSGEGTSATERLVTCNMKAIQTHGGSIGGMMDFHLAGRIYMPSLGSPLTSMGMTAIKFDKLDYLGLVKASDVVVKEADNSVESLVNNELFNIFVGQALAEGNERFKYLLDDYLHGQGIVFNTHGSKISYMRAIHDLTPDASKNLMNLLPSQLQSYGQRLLGDVFTGFEYCDVPRLGSDLRSMLRTGLYRVVMLKENGSFTTMYATNNWNILTKSYGKMYVARYESPKLRLIRFRQLLDSGLSFEEAKILTGVEAQLPAESTEEEAYAMVEGLGSSEESGDSVLTRILFASKTTGTFYRTLNVNRIYSMAKVG